MLDWRDNILAIAIRAIYRYNVLLVVGRLPPFRLLRLGPANQQVCGGLMPSSVDSAIHSCAIATVQLISSIGLG